MLCNSLFSSRPPLSLRVPDVSPRLHPSCTHSHRRPLRTRTPRPQVAFPLSKSPGSELLRGTRPLPPGNLPLSVSVLFAGPGLVVVSSDGTAHSGCTGVGLVLGGLHRSKGCNSTPHVMLPVHC